MLEHFSHDQCGLNDQDDDGDDDRDDNGDDDGDDGGDDDGGLLWSVVLRVCIECSALYGMLAYPHPPTSYLSSSNYMYRCI